MSDLGLSIHRTSEKAGLEPTSAQLQSTLLRRSCNRRTHITITITTWDCHVIYYLTFKYKLVARLVSNHHMRLQTHDLKFKFRISRQQTIVRRRRLSSRGSVYFVWDCESLSAVGSHLTTTTSLIIQLVVHNCQHVGSTLHDGWMNVKLGKGKTRQDETKGVSEWETIPSEPVVIMSACLNVCVRPISLACSMLSQGGENN